MRITSLPRLASDRRGIASVEYAVLAAVVASAVLLGSTGFAGSMGASFAQMGAATSGPGFSVKTLD